MFSPSRETAPLGRRLWGLFVAALRWLSALALLVWGARASLAGYVRNLHLAGFHDWDSAAAYRYITVLSIQKFRELPWWHPYLCGGFPAWAYAEGAPNLVSPFLPVYLLLPFQTAIRIEIVGSSLLGLAGAFLLVARFTTSRALAAFVALVYAFNGRWALQVSVGHGWHMRYAWLPFAFLFFDLACERRKSRYALLAAGVIAMMTYEAGIYPMPQTALLLFLWAAARSFTTRSWSPLGKLVMTGSFALAFAAPKIFPMVDLMMRFPRKLASEEAIGPAQLVEMLTNPHQSLHAGPVAVPAYGWHEWGIFVGIPAAIAMTLGILFARSSRERTLTLLGLLFMILSLGAIHPLAPWPILHKFPVFSSHHVPSRFAFVGVLLLLLAFVATLGRWLTRWLARWPLLDLALCVPVYFAFVPVLEVIRPMTEGAFYMAIPALTWREPFRQVDLPAYNYSPAGAWAGPSLLASMSNEGFVGCYNVPEKAEPKGAVASSSPKYRGEAYLAPVEGEVGEVLSGSAQIVSRTPNTVVVEYHDASPGSLVVLNVNHDPSWRADGGPAVDHAHAVAAFTRGPVGRVRFSYFPRMLPAGLAVFALGLFAAFQFARCTRSSRAVPLAAAQRR